MENPIKSAIGKRKAPSKKKKPASASGGGVRGLVNCPPLYPVGSPLKHIESGRYFVVQTLKDRTRYDAGEKFSSERIFCELKSLSPEPADDPAVMMFLPRQRGSICSSRQIGFATLIREYEPVPSMPPAETRRWNTFAQKDDIGKNIERLAKEHPDPVAHAVAAWDAADPEGVGSSADPSPIPS